MTHERTLRLSPSTPNRLAIEGVVRGEGDAEENLGERNRTNLPPETQRKP